MKMKFDVEFQLVVVTTETHRVAFRWNQWWGEARISVDDIETIRERHPFGMKRTRRYEVSVGESEVHRVLIEKRKPTLSGGVRQQNFRAFVDDDLVGEF